MTDCAIGPRSPDRPKSLAEQLETAVRANQCEAIQVQTRGASGPGRVKSQKPDTQCVELLTTVHPTLNRHLCWVHRHAAENFERSTALRFVEKATK